MTVTHVAARPRISAEHAFFVAMSFSLLALVCSGFSRTFLLHRWFPEVRAPAEPFFAIHGIVFLGWFVLLAVQSGLVAQRRVALHQEPRRSWRRARHGHGRARHHRGRDLRPSPRRLHWSPGASPAVHGHPVLRHGGLLVHHRDGLCPPARIREAHKRLMLIGSIGDHRRRSRPLSGDLPARAAGFLQATDLLLLPIVAWDVVSLPTPPIPPHFGPGGGAGHLTATPARRFGQHGLGDRHPMADRTGGLTSKHRARPVRAGRAESSS